MLGRILRNLFGGAPRQASSEPTSAQASLVQRALAAIDTGDLPRVTALLAEPDLARPPCAEVHRVLGSRLGRAGHLDLACNQLEAAVALDAAHAGAWADLGNVHRLAGRSEDAERCYLRALDIEPNAADIHLNLARLEIAFGKNEKAVERLRTLVAVSAHPDAVQSLVELLDRLQRTDEARAVCTGVLARHPSHGAAHASFGYLLLKREFRPAQALDHFTQSLSMGFRDARLLSNQGIALQDLGRLEEAIASYDQALTLAPGDPLAAFHRSLAMLMRGEYERAWPDYEMRLMSADRPSAPQNLPVWDGTPMNEALLVYGEQGIGDEIMFSSCMTDVMARCSNVVLTCSPKLETLFRRSFPGVQVMTQGAARGEMAAKDAARMIAIGSLPLHFRRGRAQFPMHAGYLRADPALIRMYGERLTATGGGLKVGISWRGGTDRSRRTLRSLDLDALGRILQTDGMTFVNLQYDSRPDEVELAPFLASGRIVHWQDALDDYERTAALVASLDAVVSVCTAVIHLAGALGVRTYVMAPFSPEWRYGCSGPDMPWYPAVRVERQPSPGEWAPVVAAVDEHLRDLALRKTSSANR